MPKFRVLGPKIEIPLSLGVKQVEDLDRYSEVSGMSRHELIRRAIALFFEELRDDEDFHRPGREPRDEGCRSAALPPACRFRLPPGCGEPGAWSVTRTHLFTVKQPNVAAAKVQVEPGVICPTAWPRQGQALSLPVY
jgi:hypothetical protein